MDNREESFTYTYSAKEQAEVNAIRQKYLPKEESKMDCLRRLDRIPQRKAMFWSLAVGIIGTLVLGFGMSLAMTTIGQALGAYWNGVDISMPLGIVIGILGLGLAALAYPVYKRILKKERQRIAPEIIRLTDELSGGSH